MRPAMDTRSTGGLVLGRYRIVRRLAQGGMGVVYLGRLEGAAGFSKAVVIKRVIPDIENLEETTARFIREAQILSNLQHPGIVSVLDFGEEVGGHCMVLEYVHGYDLSKWLKYLQVRGAPMPWEHAVFIMLRVLEALSYAHNFRRSDGTVAEILHRDVSPGNILVDLDGRVRLADFGIARMGEEEAGQYKTQAGVLKGKVAYLAPELFSSSPPSASSDVYACAVVLYQMLAGRNPFSAENESKVMWRLIMEEPTPLSEYRDDLPAELQAAVIHALAKDPEARYASADELAEHLRRTLTRTESVIGAEVRNAVRKDYTGDLPKTLRLEHLSDRDSAWRTGSGLPPAATGMPEEMLEAARARKQAEIDDAKGPNRDVPSIRSQATARPPSRARRGTGDPSVQPPPPPMRVRRTEGHGGEDGNAQERTLTSLGASLPPVEASAGEVPHVAVVPAASLTTTAKRRSSAGARQAPALSLKHVVGLGLSMGLVVAASVAGVIVWLQPSKNPTQRERFIVVDSRNPAAAAGSLEQQSPTGQGAVQAASVEQPKAEPVEQPHPQPTKPRRTATPAELVTQQVAKQNRHFQRCFEQHAQDIEGSPRLTLGFGLGAKGEVEQVTLSPPAMARTALGSCLLQVARTTRFSPPGKALRFSIPIQAKAVRR